MSNKILLHKTLVVIALTISAAIIDLFLGYNLTNKIQNKNTDSIQLLDNNEQTTNSTSSTDSSIKKLAQDNVCSDVLKLLDNNNAIMALQETTASLADELATIQSANSSSQDFLKANPIGSIFITLNSTNPKDIYGGTWIAYSQGRVMIGQGTTTDSKGTVVSYNTAGQTGGQFNQLLSISNIPAHTHTVTATGTVTGTCNISGSTNTTGSHTHTQAAHNHIQARAAFMNDANYYDCRVNGGTNIPMGADFIDYYTSSEAPYIHNSGAHSHTYSASGQISVTFSGTTATTSSIGSGNAFNIQNPYIVVYIWKRTA